ncbi:hypothetical protein [Eubacterium sp. 14-2]|uniref:hypothetical protein n=1 Tax=Eubacterium sp. 14-2 TaxID=1235790 RepID=UPI0018CAC81F|nr:hypothetical protein [Eubacterium sp. 14-2]
MRVLAACEESQRVCIEFRKLGHEAYSCDIEPCSGGHEEWHIQNDVLPILNGNCEFQTVDGMEHRIDGKWDMIIAFPPCTYLTVTGNRWFNVEQYGDKAIKREEDRKKAIQFFMRFVHADCEKIAIENPVGIMSSNYQKPDQIIQPYEYGHTERKRTCLWLKGLPFLTPTNIVEPELHICGNEVVDSKWHYDTYSLPPKIRAKERSKTFLGIAKAMAEQWGKVDEPTELQYHSVHRHSWQHYGITKERYMQLTEYIQSGRYASLASQAAHRANETIAEYILLSVTQNKSYDALRVKWELKEMEQIPYCRTDFYGIRRYFYYLFDLEVRKEECMKN